MAYLNRDEHIPIWLPLWLPDDLLEEIYLGILAARECRVQDREEASDPATGYIFQGWFGPFLLSPPTLISRGRC